MYVKGRCAQKKRGFHQYLQERTIGSEQVRRGLLQKESSSLQQKGFSGQQEGWKKRTEKPGQTIDEGKLPSAGGTASPGVGFHLYRPADDFGFEMCGCEKINGSRNQKSRDPQVM